MKKTPCSKPVVLVLAGHDPGGGAGIQADIETIAANGCHAATVLTAMTIQSTVEFRRYITVKPEDFLQQVECVCSDMEISACKIGLIGDIEILRAVETALQALRDVPVVLDPVIWAGTGENIMPDNVQIALYSRLLPHVTVITPNSVEARTLARANDPAMAAEYLLKSGCKAMLITGTHDPSPRVINILYQANNPPMEFAWPRLLGSYHGSGCTLSSAIAANLARGKDPGQAVAEAQEYTWNTLHHGLQLGKKQYHPDRFYQD